MEDANDNLQPSKTPKNKNIRFVSDSDLKNSSLPMKSDNSTKNSRRRIIRCLSDFDNLKRSSLTPGLFAKQAVIKVKKNTRKPNNLGFLPKIDMEDSSKENFTPNKNVEKLKGRTSLRSDKTELNKIQQKSIKKSYLNNFVVTNLEDSFDVPSLSGNKEESPDEVVFKPRLKKHKAVSSKTVSEVGDIEDSVSKSLIKKSSKKRNSALKRHSSLSGSFLSNKNTDKKDDVEYSPTENPVNKAHRKISFNCTSERQSSFNKSIKRLEKSTEVELKSNKHLSPKARTTYRKSVRFTTPPQENTKKRSTFELESSTFDVSLLPDADKTYTQKRSYLKSPHVKKIKQHVTPEDSLTEFEQLEANISNDSLVNKKLTKRGLSTAQISSCSLQASNSVKYTPLLQKGSDCSQTIIDLVTPPSKKTGLDEICNQNNSDLSIKVNNSARKRWSKPVEPSFLESFEYLHNVSAPWENQTISSSPEDRLNNTFSKMSENKNRNKKPVVSFKSSFLTTPSSSTPIIKQKGSVIEQGLLKDKPKIPKDKNNVPSVTKTKMPNFTRIHQKAYEKMENIKEMSERKAARAQLLLSGQKPEFAHNVQVKSPKIKKMLNYSPKKVFTPVTKSTKINTSKLTVNVMTTVEVVQPSTSNPKTSHLPKPVQRKIENTKTTKIPRLINVKRINQDKPISKYGFKFGPEKSVQNVKEVQIKAVATKSRVPNDPVKKARNIVKEVRSNRRFELLMQMRQKNKH